VAVSIAVVCEAPADARTGCELADRVICEEIDWAEAGMLDALRSWSGIQSSDRFLLWRDVPELAATRRIRVHGHFQGEPGAPDAHAALKALLVLHSSETMPNAFILLRDDDGESARKTGLSQARERFSQSDRVAIGLAGAKRECWVLAGFDPKDASEERSLAAVRQQIGFDPREKSEQLTAKHNDDKLSAKRVLAELCDGDLDREAECWRSENLTTLKSRGEKNGLKEYLAEISAIVCPIVGRR
jgi:hypothetical protein